MERIFGNNVLDVTTGYHINLIDGVNHTTGVHDHDFYEIFLILQGQAIHWRNRQREILIPGTAAFVHPGDSHSYSQMNPGPFKMLNIAFSVTEWHHLKDFLILQETPWLLVYGDAREAEELAREALGISAEKDREVRLRKLRVLTVRILSAQPGGQSNSPYWLRECCKPDCLREIREGGVKVLRDITGFSPGYLTRTFTAHTGLTPAAWVARERLTETIRLLKSTDWDILRVAQEGGYGNLSHFYRQFKEAYSISPGAFRRTGKGQTGDEKK